MGQNTHNKLRDVAIRGDYIGGDQANYYFTLYQESEREFVVTHNANIKPVSYFTGRETELQELRQRIEEGRKSVLVSGMGGIGKTHICRKLFEEYLNRHAEDESGLFRHIGYIEYNGDMDSSLQNGLKFKQQDNLEQNRKAAWEELEHLAADGKLLLFVDNVDRPIGTDLGLQRLKGIPGAVVLTSRQASFSDEFEPYRIGFLGMEQCKEIYEKIRFEGSDNKVKSEEIPDLEYIIEHLAGRHTITIELLAHLAHTKLWTVQKLREALKNRGFRLEFHKDGELVNIQESYEALYDLSGLTEAEKNILEAFSVFPYIPLETEICNEWLLADAGASEDDDILMGLYHKGWLQFDLNQESYALHPVFAQFIYEKCKPKAERHMGLIAACQKSLEIPRNGSVLKCTEYIPFAENMHERMDMGGGEQQAIFICVLAFLLEHIAEYKKAEKLFQKGLCISKKVFGTDHPSTAAVYNNLAYVYGQQGDYKKAEELYRKSLQINKKMLGEESLDVATNYDNLANVYSAQGEYGKAEELQEKGLKIREKILGEKHIDTAGSYNNLAVIYEKQGKYAEAERLHQKSLRISERLLGEENPDIATSYNNLAEMYQKRGEYKKAEELCGKSLQIRKKVLGEEHPDTAVGYNNLAEVYKCQGRYKEAEELYKKSLQINERILGEGHLSTATGYNNLAGLYEDQGKCEEAEKLYEKSLQISERILGEGHPDLATSYNNLAVVYEKLGKYTEAEELHKKSIYILERALGEEHLSVAASYNNLAAVYERQGKYEKAEELCKKSLRIKEKWLGEGHLDTALSYENLAVLYGNLGKYIEAEKLCKKSLQIREKVLGEGHPDTAKCCSNLAKIYYWIKEYRMALDYNFRAYKFFAQRLGSEDSYTKNLYKNMDIIYATWNPDGDFEQWLKEQIKELEHN